MKDFFRISISLLFALVALATAVYAQDNDIIKGGVTDASGNPVEFATVAAMTQDSIVVSAGVSAEDGSFELSVPHGKYILQISMVGYRSAFTDISTPCSIQIKLEDDREMLEAARVTDRVSLVEMKLDKLVMNVSQSAFAQGSNGLELLKKAPGVTIDKDGNIKLNGKSVAIWIDGRPSYMNGESLLALLRSTSGESIDKLEIMEHPSSKYDAAGQGGIINIKTKRNFANGFNGSIGLNGGGMYFGDNIDRAFGQVSGWGNFAYKGRKTNTFVNIYDGLFGTGVVIDVDSWQNGLEGGDMRMISSSLQSFRFSNGQIKAGNDWFINDRNIFGVIVSIPYSNSVMASDRSHNFSRTTIGDIPVESMESETSNASRRNQFTGNLNYTHTFDEKRSAEITVNLDWYRAGGGSDNRQTNYYVDDSGREDFRRIITSDNLLNIYSAKADYQTVLWGKAMFEAGGKWAISVTDNETCRTETAQPERPNIFRYSEHIGAAYSSLAMQLGPKWSLKAGLRGEYTGSIGDWKSAGQKTDRQYFDLFPTVFVGYNPSEKLRTGLSYTRRIERPGYNFLNPAEEFIDAHSYMVGNPELLPQYTDELYLQFGIGQHISFAIGDNYTGQLIAQIPLFDADGNQALMFDNFGSCNMVVLGLNFSSVNITKWLEWSLSVNGLYFSNKGAENYTNKSMTVQGYTNFTFLLPKSWKIECDAMYSSPMAYGYFNIEPTFTCNLATKKTLLDGRMTLTMRVDDVFRTTSSNLTMDSAIPGAGSYYKQQMLNQSAVVGLSWNFGKAQQTKVRNVGNLEEASRANASSGIGKQ